VRAHPDPIVLQTSVDTVGRGHVDGYGIKLAEWYGVAFNPGFAIVVRDVDATVIAEDEMSGALGIDPERVVINVYVIAVDAGPGFTAIIAPQNRHTKSVYLVGLVGLCPYLPEIVAVRKVNIVEIAVVGTFPGFSLVIGAIDFETHDSCFKKLAVGIFIVAGQGSGFDTAGGNILLDAGRCIARRESVGLQIVA